MPSFARSVTPRSVMSWPSNQMLPEVGLIMPATSFARVDLPPPLGPVMATKRSLTWRLTSVRMSLTPPFSSPAL